MNKLTIINVITGLVIGFGAGYWIGAQQPSAPDLQKISIASFEGQKYIVGNLEKINDDSLTLTQFPGMSMRLTDKTKFIERETAESGIQSDKPIKNTDLKAGTTVSLELKDLFEAGKRPEVLAVIAAKPPVPGVEPTDVSDLLNIVPPSGQIQSGGTPKTPPPPPADKPPKP